MKVKSVTKYIIILLLLSFVIAFANKDYILYNYYMWRLRNTSEGALILDLHESIQKIAPSIPHLLTETFKKQDIDWKNRHASMLALIEVDKKEAEKLFTKYLTIGNPDQISVSIFGLYVLKSVKQADTIIKLANSSTSDIRANVALYLSLIKTNESEKILSELIKDKDNKVRYEASGSIKLLRKEKGTPLNN